MFFSTPLKWSWYYILYTPLQADSQFKCKQRKLRIFFVLNSNFID